VKGEGDDRDTNAALRLFAARVGNEIRNPLAAVLSAHEYLRRRILAEKGVLADDPTVRQFMEIIEREIGNASRVADDLATFGLEPTVSRSTFLLPDLVREVLSRFSTAVAIRCDVAEDLPPVYLDRALTRRALAHVTHNAIDATMAEGKSGEIVVDARVADDRVELSISDAGAGLSDEDLARFKDPLISTKAKGIGLGLAVADALVRAQGGTMRSERRAQGGTKVTLCYPAAQAGE
jgi:signal transduction histidine kinase